MNFTILPFFEKYFAVDEPFIIGCSTGSDSMYLLYKILETPYRKNMIAAYFNHHTREQCSQEEAFLCELWKKENFTVEIWECDFEKIKKLYPGKSFEELAREKRYQFFDALCHIHWATKVILAHHLDDRIETMFFHMLRGTKLSGLINMTEISGNIYRPLISLEKKEIKEYLEKNELQYYEDETNAGNEHTRNYIRNQISPLLGWVHPEYKKNISQLLKYFEVLHTENKKNVEHFLKTSQENGLWESFLLSDFENLSDFLQKEVIVEIYSRQNGNSTIWLSEWNIAEILRFFHGKNNPTEKQIHKLSLFKKNGRIFYNK